MAEFSRTENRMLGALARLDDFLMNPLLQGHSGTTPETSWNMFIINQGTNEDDSQSNPHPEAGLLTSGREDRHDMATGVQRERGRERERVRRRATGIKNSCYPVNLLFSKLRWRLVIKLKAIYEIAFRNLFFCLKNENSGENG